MNGPIRRAIHTDSHTNGARVVMPQVGQGTTYLNEPLWREIIKHFYYSGIYKI